MATKPTTTPDDDAAESNTIQVQPGLESLWLGTAVVFLLLAVIIMLYAAGVNLGEGPFAKK